MGTLIEFPEPSRNAACPHRQYLRTQNKNGRTELAVFGLLGSCAVAGLLLLGASKSVPGSANHSAPLQARATPSHLVDHLKTFQSSLRRISLAY